MILRRFGPALIVGSVVLGPGSILANTKVGAKFGYDLVWVVVGAAVLMATMTALSARIGVGLDATPCEALARRRGRPLAALVGVVLFLVVASFQVSNNVAVFAATESLTSRGVAFGVVAGINALVLAALFGFRHLYVPLERAMKLCVALMAAGFMINLVCAGPSLGGVAGGLIPRLPDGIAEIPPEMIALVATTLSIAGAFYQAYLVRQKGWTSSDVGKGIADSVFGITVLGALSLAVMVTAAAVLRGRPGVDGFQLTDLAEALAPMFGGAATGVFAVGLLAAAFSSFLGNVLIGGTILSDGLGHGGDIDRVGPKVCTAVALLLAMSVALATGGERPVGVILFAQALTVLGNPLLVLVLIGFGLSRGPDGRRRAPAWTLAVALVVFAIVVALAIRTAGAVIDKL